MSSMTWRPVQSRMLSELASASMSPSARHPVVLARLAEWPRLLAIRPASTQGGCQAVRPVRLGARGSGGLPGRRHDRTFACGPLGYIHAPHMVVVITAILAVTARGRFRANLSLRAFGESGE